jgi:hypothetical protein
VFQFGSSVGAGDGDVLCEFGIPVVGWFREDIGGRGPTALGAVEHGEVFSDWFGVGPGGKFGDTDAVSN